jgi:hypothetical protein
MTIVSVKATVMCTYLQAAERFVTPWNKGFAFMNVYMMMLAWSMTMLWG